MEGEAWTQTSRQLVVGKMYSGARDNDGYVRRWAEEGGMGRGVLGRRS